MRKLLILIGLALVGLQSYSQVNVHTRYNTRNGSVGSTPGDGGPQSSINIDTLSATTTDFVYSPFRGAGQWHAGNDVAIPSTTITTRSDAYYRSFYRTNLVNPNYGVYDWTVIDDDIKAAIRLGQKFQCGFMTYFDGASTDYYAHLSNGYAAYPPWLHDSMQLASGTLKDWITNGTGPSPGCSGTGCYWVPNWNSPAYLRFVGRLLKNFADHIATTSYTPPTGPWAGTSIAFSSVFTGIDVRFYGNYGEWHYAGLANSVDDSPSGTKMTPATAKAIIDSTVFYFDNYWVFLMYGALEAGNTGFPNLKIDPETSYYALRKTHTDGRKLGWRRDSWGWTDAYLAEIGPNNDVVFDPPGADPPMRMDSAIMNRYLYAPITGESGGFVQMTELAKQTEQFHITQFGNSNYGVTQSNPGSVDTIRKAARIAGNKTKLTSGTVSTTITRGIPFSVTLNWKNTGVGCVYERWNIMFELRNAGNVTVWSSQSSMGLFMFRPSGTSTQVTDLMTIPISVSPGTYSLRMVVRDPNGYREPFPIYNGNPTRQTDGSYIIKSSVVF